MDEPEAYILGSVDFLKCKIDLSKRPLIPRVETEFWVEKAIKVIQAREAIEAIRCLDIFAGSGCNIDASRFQIIKSDVFENVSGSYDYIFANPPYVAEEKIEDVQDSVLNYEPHNALFGGADGLLYIRTFLEKAHKYLNKGGKIYMEFDPHEKEEIERISKSAGYKEIKFHQDQFQRWRHLSLSA